MLSDIAAWCCAFIVAPIQHIEKRHISNGFQSSHKKGKTMNLATRFS